MRTPTHGHHFIAVCDGPGMGIGRAGLDAATVLGFVVLDARRPTASMPLPDTAAGIARGLSRQPIAAH